MRPFLICTLLLLHPLATAAQAPAVPPPGFLLTADPAGFLQFGPSMEAEFTRLGPAGFAVGARVPSWGMLSHVVDEELGFAWLGTGALRFYLSRRAQPRGFWLGPRFEIGEAESGGDVYLVKAGGLDAGYRWISSGGAVLSLGLFAGGLNSDSGLQGNVVAGVVSVGVAP